MEENQNQNQNQVWDWEVLIDDSHYNHQNPNLEIEQDDHKLEKDSSFSDLSIIQNDYFSLQFDSHKVDHLEIEPELEPEPETESWIDPTQVQFSINMKKRRYHFSSSSSQSDVDSPTEVQSNDLFPTQMKLGFQNHLNDDFSDTQMKLGFQNHQNDDFSDTQMKLGFESSSKGEEIDQNDNFSDTQMKLVFENSSKDEEIDQNDNFSDTQITNEEDLMKNDVESSGLIEKEEKIEALGDKNNEMKKGWWKVSLELLRYCLLRVRPVWSLSVAAAAVMGFVLFRRAWLFRMKRKAAQKGIRLNVTVDDKKVSQFMSRAARLNEAFSVVKRIPAIRPSLSAPGLAPWPVISMR